MIPISGQTAIRMQFNFLAQARAQLQMEIYLTRVYLVSWLGILIQLISMVSRVTFFWQIDKNLKKRI
jgi:hypothetical protein